MCTWSSEPLGSGLNGIKPIYFQVVQVQEGVLPQRACAPGQMLQVAWCIKVKVIWVFIFHWFELFQVKLGDVFTKMRKKNF